MTNTVVKYHARFTKNMGNYESLQIEVGVEDSPRGEETAGAAFDRVKAFVEERLLDSVNAVEEELRN